LVPPGRLAALRYRSLTLNGETRSEPGSLVSTADVYGLYDDQSRTIYLRDDWQGVTVTEISILVHEMVHHLQNVAGQKHPCAQARETLAYEAQSKWLAVFGKKLSDEFGLDPFSVLAKSLCLH